MEKTVRCSALYVTSSWVVSIARKEVVTLDLLQRGSKEIRQARKFLPYVTERKRKKKCRKEK